MTPRRTRDVGADAPDLMGVKATDELFERLSLGIFAAVAADAAQTGTDAAQTGTDPAGNRAHDAVALSLSAFAADAQTPPAAGPSLDELLIAAGLVLRPASADAPGVLERIGHPDLSLLDGLDAQSEAAASGWAGRLALGDRMPWVDQAGQRVGVAAGFVAEQAGRGLRRIGVDTGRVPRISPMVAAAAAVVAFGLTGVATGMLSADPLSSVSTADALSGSEIDAEQVAELLAKARMLARAGRADEAQRYYYAASALVHRLRSAPERAQFAREVEDLRVNLGLPATKESGTGDGRTPATPDATTVATHPSAVIIPTLPKAATPPPSVSTSTTAAPTTTEPSTTPTPTPTPTPDPTPTPTPTPDPTPTPTPTPTDDVAPVGDSGGDASTDASSNHAADPDDDSPVVAPDEGAATGPVADVLGADD